MNTQNTWSLRNLYLYLVCLITLIMVIFSAVNVVRAVIDLAYPDPGYYMPVPVAPDGKPSSSDQAQIQQQQQDIQRQQTTRNAVLSLVGSGTMLLLAGPLWIYHWRKIERKPSGVTQ
jgi:hypothetical protein